MERIKKYLEEASQTDPALKSAYDDTKLPACWDYIKNQARKSAKNGCAMIEYSIVYKWARDFMFGDIAEEDKKKYTKTSEKSTESNKVFGNSEQLEDFVNSDSEMTNNGWNIDSTDAKLVIQKVEQEEPEAVVKESLTADKPKKKAKKQKEDFYDGPSLFDDLF